MAAHVTALAFVHRPRYDYMNNNFYFSAKVVNSFLINTFQAGQVTVHYNEQHHLTKMDTTLPSIIIFENNKSILKDKTCCFKLEVGWVCVFIAKTQRHTFKNKHQKQ